MLLNIEQISQPYSGEYEEIIFDIESNWNSSDWSWIRFEEDNQSCPYNLRRRLSGTQRGHARHRQGSAQ